MRSEMLMTENQPQEATTAGHRVAARAVAVVALGAVALIHLIDAPGKFQETPYVGGLYVALMAGALLAAAILRAHARGRRLRDRLELLGLAALDLELDRELDRHGASSWRRC